MRTSINKNATPGYDRQPWTRRKARRARLLPAVFAATSAAATAGPAAGLSLAGNSFDADSYLYIGTNNAYATELTIGVDTSGLGVYHFNFAHAAFGDLSAIDPAGPAYLRFEVEAYASTEIIDGFPVTTLSEDGSATMRVIPMGASYSDYLAASDKPGWYAAHIAGQSAAATTTFSGTGWFDVEVSSAVAAWQQGTADNHGFALVLSSGDAVELGANEGGNGVTLADTAFLVGDTDSDGDIDDSDLGTAFANYTGPVGGAGGKTSTLGDTDNDGDVDDSDLGSLFSNYTGPINPVTVPEPGVMALLGIGALVMLRRRRRASA